MQKIDDGSMLLMGGEKTQGRSRRKVCIPYAAVCTEYGYLCVPFNCRALIGVLLRSSLLGGIAKGDLDCLGPAYCAFQVFQLLLT